MANIVYRALNVNEYNFKYNQDIVWVSTSREHSKMYSDGVGKVFTFKIIGTLNALDLQFTSAEVDVKFKDITERFKSALLDQFEIGKLSREKTLDLFDEINAMRDSSEMKEVWRWMENKDLTKFARKCGYNAILQREGFSRYAGNVITYGILDSRMLSMIRDD